MVCSLQWRGDPLEKALLLTAISSARAFQGAHQVQAKLQALAHMVSSGASQLMDGVGTITSIRDASNRVHVDDVDEESGFFQGIASRNRLSTRPRVDSGASMRRDIPVKGSGGGVGSRVGVRATSAREATPQPGVRPDQEVR